MHLPRLVLVLSLLLAPAAHASGDRPRSFGARFTTTYGSCAPYVLAKAWQKPAFRAAQRAGRLAYTGKESKVASEVSTARTRFGSAVWCDITEARLSWQDMDALAAFWGMDDYETKMRVQEKLLQGGDVWLRSEAKLARARSGSRGGPLTELFFAKGYTFCDAQVLAAYWFKETWEAKDWAGQKISDGGLPVLEAELTAARSALAYRAEEVCDWTEKWSYYDVEVLVTYWGKAPFDVKQNLALSLFWGEAFKVEAELAEARMGGDGGEGYGDGGEGWFPDDDPISTFLGSDYTYCDAWVYSKAWDTSIEEAKSSIGYKTSHGYEQDIHDGLTRGRSVLRAQGTDRCDHDWVGISNDDLAALAVRWGMEPEAAKAIVERRLFDGDGDDLFRQLGRR